MTEIRNSVRSTAERDHKERITGPPHRASLFVYFFLLWTALLVHPATAQLIFEDGFETGDVSRWSLFSPELNVSIQNPIPNAVLLETIDVSGKVFGPASAVTVNGINATVIGSNFWAYGIPLAAEGPNVLEAIATSGLLTARHRIQVNRDTTPPEITIVSPQNGNLTAATSVLVEGTLGETAPVTVNGVVAAVEGLTWRATIAVREGPNLIQAEASDLLGNQGRATVQLIRDTMPPRVTIQSPSPGSAVTAGTITATGTIHDGGFGFVNSGDVTVTVNGVVAEVANGSWAALGVPVAEGETLITAVAKDRLGHTDSISNVVLAYSEPSAKIAVETGDGQTAVGGAALANPLVVKVTNNANSPIAGASVVFRVARGDGRFGNNQRIQTVVTDGTGRASVSFILGTRAGAGSDRVEAQVAGYLEVAGFCATATPLPSRRLIVVSGLNQVGFARFGAIYPLVVLVTDEEGNPVQNASVDYEVIKGSSKVNGAETATVLTDNDGQASALLVLGSEIGVRSQKVRVTVAGAPDSVELHASTIEGGGARTIRTTAGISGVVLNNENQPLAGVTMRLVGTDPEISGVTNNQGRFLLQGPAGPIKLHVDGSTELSEDLYPHLEYELELLPGVENPMDRPIYLPKVDLDGKALASSTSDVVLTRADTPGFELKILAGSATFAPGTPTTEVQVIRVNRDKIPMAPPDGTDPAMAISIQPPSVHFDPPAPLRLPNTDGRDPGEIVQLFSFDHDVGAFIPVSTMRVTEDGAFMESEPGQGVVKGGWHYAPPVPPIRVTFNANNTVLKWCQDDGGPLPSCKSCRLAGGPGNACQCDRPVNNGQPERPNNRTPDFECILEPGSAGYNGNNKMPCLVSNIDELWSDPPPSEDFGRDLNATEAQIVAAVNAISDPDISAFFEPAGTVCIRRYENPIPFVGLAANAIGKCQYPVLGNPLGHPICCPDGYWDAIGKVCCLNPVGGDGLCN